MLDNTIIEEFLEIKFQKNIKIQALGLINSVLDNTLSFLDDELYLSLALENKNITSLITNKQIANQLADKNLDIYIIIVDDPRYSYYTLYNHLGKENQRLKKSIIHKSSIIHPKSFISDVNVIIGKNTIIGPNVTILNDVVIGDNCIIQPGTVIGSEGFEYKKTSKGIISVFHDGKVVIGNNVEVGANTCIDKGFSNRNTIIGDNNKIDNLVHIAHGVQTEKDNFIIANSMLGGSVSLKNNVWIGPNSTIAPQIEVKDNGFVSLGSVVTKDVLKNKWVTGNFAIPHNTFLKNLKKNLG